MTAGELFVRATAWLAFVAYVGGTAAGLRHPHGRAFRLFWISGASLLLVHMLAAFHFKHGWSHAAAYADTARLTGSVTGLNWGGGVYLNYLLAIIWLADALRLPRSKPLIPSITCFYAFMWFNAAVVFVPGPMRWVGTLAFAFLAILAWRRWRRPADPAQ